MKQEQQNHHDDSKDYQLAHCEKCNQMTNHLNNVCQKCKKKINGILVCPPHMEKTDAMIQSMKNKIGNDIVVITPDEAKIMAVGLGGSLEFHKEMLSLISYIKEMEQINIPIVKAIEPIAISGKESRRQRRMEERKNKNKK